MTETTRRSARSRYWIGKARIGRGWGAFVGVVGDNASHRHHAIQAFAGTRVRLEHSATKASVAEVSVADGFVLPPDFTHRARAAEESAFLYVDPDTLTGQAIARHVQRDVRILSPTDANALRAIVENAIDRGETANPVDALAELVGAPHAQARRVDARVTALIDNIARTGEVYETVGAAAASVGVSESRLIHLFSQQVGVPWRTFLLWTKLRRAIETVAAGTTLTAAAHAGGFADSAHLSRTCRTMFGINPHAMTRGLAFYK